MSVAGAAVCLLVNHEDSQVMAVRLERMVYSTWWSMTCTGTEVRGSLVTATGSAPS